MNWCSLSNGYRIPQLNSLHLTVLFFTHTYLQSSTVSSVYISTAVHVCKCYQYDRLQYNYNIDFINTDVHVSFSNHRNMLKSLPNLYSIHLNCPCWICDNL